MASEGITCPSVLDALLSKNVPHILEKIFFSLDYASFKECCQVSNKWNVILTSDMYQTKGKSVFCKDIREEEKKLHAASGVGNTEEVRRLLSCGMVDVNSIQGDLPHLSLYKGGNPDRKVEDFGLTPLHLSAREGHRDVSQVLIDHGADPDKMAYFGKTPLHEAAMNGHRDLVQLLIDNGANLNRGDIFKQTPLYSASKNGHCDVVQCLLGNGAKPNEADANGETPLYWAMRNKHKDIAQLLKERGAGQRKKRITKRRR